MKYQSFQEYVEFQYSVSPKQKKMKFKKSSFSPIKSQFQLSQLTLPKIPLNTEVMENCVSQREIIQNIKLDCFKEKRINSLYYSNCPNKEILPSQRLQQLKQKDIKQKKINKIPKRIELAQQFQLSPKLKSLSNVQKVFDYQQEQIKQQSNPISNRALIKNFLQEKIKNSTLTVANTSVIDQAADKFFNSILSDPLLQSIFSKVNPQSIRKIHQSIFEIALGKEMMYSQEQIRKGHSNLSLTNRQFDRMKYHLITQILTFNPERTIQYVAKIEQYRPYVLNKQSLYDILGGRVGLEKICHLMYSKIYSDFSMNLMFKEIDFDEQIIKFTRLISYLINTIDAPNYPLETLRDRHKSYNINYVNFANFKYYLALAQREVKIDEKVIMQVIQLMDGFKSALINEDSILQLINKNYEGLKEFSDRYIRNCLKDIFTKQLILKVGVDKSIRHAFNMFSYFFNRELISFRQKELKCIHQHLNISSKTFDLYKSKAYSLVKNLNPNPILLQDFEEEWINIKPFIVSNFNEVIQNTEQNIQEIAIPLSIEIRNNDILMKTYKDLEMTPEINAQRHIQFLLSHSRYFKKTDIQALHQQLHISEDKYQEFIRCLKKSSQHGTYLKQLAEEWKDCIIYKK